MSLLTDRLCQVFEQHSSKILITENFSGRSLTGGELLEWSGKIAAALKAKGTKRGTVTVTNTIDVFTFVEISDKTTLEGQKLVKYAIDTISFLNGRQNPISCSNAFDSISR
ncbi:MAG: hypothetical protein IIT46_08860 [Lachnospiraceae bacterium]|nr:hypothetical protein [Lachnospiraceae bacterium]